MAFDFTGLVSKYLVATTPPVTVAPFSFMCWGWQDSVVSSKNTLLFLGDQTSQNNFWQMYTSNSSPPSFGFIIRDSSAWSGNTTALGQSLGQWNFYGAEVPAAPTAGKLWNASGSASFNNTITPSGITDFAIGVTLRSVPEQPWDGAIAEVAVWDVILTAAEWGLLRKGFDPRMIRPGSLKFYRSLVRNLDFPYGPGANLTNTGSVGVRAHRTMRYRSGHHRIGFADPGTTATVPGAPNFLSSLPYSSEAVRIVLQTTDSGGSPITKTHVEYRVNSVGGAWTAEFKNGHLAVYLLRGLTPGVLYDLRARQENAIGLGAYSAETTGLPHNLADAEDSALIGFSNEILMPPFYGGGTITQADQQQLLKLPIDPLLGESSVIPGQESNAVGTIEDESALVQIRVGYRG